MATWTYGTTVTGQADAVATGTLTIGVTANENLLVFYSANERNAGFASVGTVQYNGTNLTFAIGTQITQADDDRAEIWYLNNPGTGTSNLIFSYNNAPDGWIAAASTYGNIKNQAPEAVASRIGTAPSSGSVTITTITSNALLVGVCEGISSAITITTDTTGSQTERWNVTNAGNTRAAGGDKDTGAAGGYYMRWTFGAVNDFAAVAAAFAVNTAETQKPNWKNLEGVGY